MKILTIFLLLVIMATSTFGFDNCRKGFVLGGGLGLAPVSMFSHFSVNENAPGIAFNALMGYGLDNDNIISFETNISFRNSSYYSKESPENNNIFGSGLNLITHGYYGTAWYHYFGRPGKSYFTAAGLGLYKCNGTGVDNLGSSIAVLFGGGYEFKPHYQIAGYFSFGKSKYIGFSQFSVIISRVAF